MNKYARRKDANHSEISTTFMQMGWSVIDTHNYQGIGFDLLIKKHNTPLYAIEIKDSDKFRSQQKLTASEETAKKIIGRYYVIIDSVEGAITFNNNRMII